MSTVHKSSVFTDSESLHSKAIFELLELDIGRCLIEHLVQSTIGAVESAFGVPSSQTRGRSGTRLKKYAGFAEFVSSVVSRSEVKIEVLLVALVYIDRAKAHLLIETEELACQRIFLGALILASKYISDSTLKNVDWSLITEVFGERFIGRIEREFLDVLDWDLGIKESDILAHHDSLMSLYPQSRLQRSSHRIPIPRARLARESSH